MTKQAIIERTIEAINRLPVDIAEEISDFADGLRKRHEEEQLADGIRTLVENGGAFEFLHDEEDIYSVVDLKEIYNG